MVLKLKIVNVTAAAALLMLTILSLISPVQSYGTSDEEFKRISDLRDELEEKQSLSYFFQLLNGLKADDYVPGSINCSLDIIASQVDINTIIYYFAETNDSNRPDEDKKRAEAATFLIFRELTQNLPRAIYNCYFIPQVSSFMWRQHLAKFQDWEDFEAGFVQNLMG